MLRQTNNNVETGVKKAALGEEKQRRIPEASKKSQHKKVGLLVFLRPLQSLFLSTACTIEVMKNPSGTVPIPFSYANLIWLLLCGISRNSTEYALISYVQQIFNICNMLPLFNPVA